MRFLLFSANPSCSEQTAKGSGVVNIDSAVVAEQVMVSPPVRVDSGPAHCPAGQGGPSVSGERSCSSGTIVVPPSRIQVIEQSLREKGFSRPTAAAIARPQRASTLATFERVWQKFADWCNGRQIDPIRPAVTQVANYLMYLFTVKQFSLRSIGLYRTAVASTIKNSGGRISVIMPTYLP